MSQNPAKEDVDEQSTQHYCCVVIPGLVEINGPWKVLPPGIHDATMDEIKQTFATNEVRTFLFEGFVRGVEALARAGCLTLYLDGSFVTEKPNPGDYDVCWDAVGVNVNQLDPVLLDFSQLRKAQKQKFGGEFFPSGFSAHGTQPFMDFFQIDKYTGNRKGILRVNLTAKRSASP